MLMYDIVIIGAGTAGMSAAIYGVRSGKKVLLLEEKNYGGQIVNTPEVENYPGIIKTSGFEFATNLFNQAKSLGAEIKYEKAVEIKNNGVLKEVVTNKETYETKAIIIATGAKNRSLKLDKEKEFIGSGVSYCATCDGMFFRGRDVAVVGGGNTALEDAMFLSNYCNKVYIIHRRDKLRGEEKIAKAISEKDNIEMVWNSNVVKLIGDDKVEGITVKNSVDGSEKDIQVSGLFIAVGQEPDNYDFEEVVELDDKGYVIAGEDCKTESRGIFTAGDCRTKNVRQLTTAASDGAVAAIGACEYIDSELDRLLTQLRNEKLDNLSQEDFAKRLAYYWSELNVLHPFREGNGRTTREFIRQIALKYNYNLNLQNFTAQEILDASIKSIVNTQDLENIVNKCLEHK